LTKKRNISGADNQPVHLNEWVAANQPRLHPTRKKVLAAAARLTADGQAVPSTEVRQEVGLSQQLLNRHLHGLEEDGLVALERPGPGRPLEITATPAGLRAAGLRGPQRQPLAPAEPETRAEAEPEPEHRPEPPPQPEPRAEARPRPAPEPEPEPAPQPEPQAAAEPPLPAAPPVSGRVARFVDSLYDALAPYCPALGRAEFRALVRPALGSRPQAPALHRALAAHLGHMDRALFTEILAEVARRAARGPAPARPRTPARRDPAQPPALGPAGEALERQLAESCHPEYHGLPWHRRTRLLSDEWDLCRRRRLGAFNTAFDNFAPRWQRRDWPDFNQARRQADGRGADYREWVAAQFDRLAPRGEAEVPPEALHGDEALEAYRRRHPEQEQTDSGLGPPPYGLKDFRLDDPGHVAYAQRLIEEIAGLARRVLGKDYEDGPPRLLAEAVRAGTLPAAALELAPRWREATLARLKQGGLASGSGLPQPPVII
jgi:hypothetical protein